MTCIFIGVNEVAGIVFTYGKAFRALGYETHTVVLRKRLLRPDSEYDVVIQEDVGKLKAMAYSSGFWARVLILLRAWVISLSIFLRALATCDIFIFVWGSPSMLPKHWDYPILKMLGKRIVTVFLGSDIRYCYALAQEIRLLGLEDEYKPYLDYLRSRSEPGEFYRKIHEVRAAERYADLILSHPAMGQLETRPYMIVCLPLPLSEYSFNVPGRRVPLVIHAPSNPEVKGTKYVLAAVKQLQREGVRFNFRMISSMPNKQLRELLTQADIVVDQLFSQTTATLSLESMATGNAVLTNYRTDRVRSDCPAVKVSIYTLVDQLRKVILDRNLRRRLANEGRMYVEKYHDHTEVAKQILRWLKPAGIGRYDVVPTFFQNHFFIPPELLRKELAGRSKNQTSAGFPIPARLKSLILWPLTHGS